MAHSTPNLDGSLFCSDWDSAEISPRIIMQNYNNSNNRAVGVNKTSKTSPLFSAVSVTTNEFEATSSRCIGSPEDVVNPVPLYNSGEHFHKFVRILFSTFVFFCLFFDEAAFNILKSHCFVTKEKQLM